MNGRDLEAEAVRLRERALRLIERALRRADIIGTRDRLTFAQAAAERVFGPAWDVQVHAVIGRLDFILTVGQYDPDAES